MKPRKGVQWFAERMENKFRENDDKDGWGDSSSDYLFKRMDEEYEELKDKARQIGWHIFCAGDCEDYIDQFIDECADIANFAMMIADNAERKKGKK